MLANFQFKIIIKIITNKLVILAPKIVLEHQKDFIKGRYIYDCIDITSEVTNC